MRLLATLLLLCSCASGPAPAPAAGPPPPAVAVSEPGAAATLEILLTGFRSDDGQALIAIYRGGDGFPGEPGKAWKQMSAGIQGKEARVEVADVPAGEYAVAVIHDENGNNRMDTSFIGIPKEGLGASNNAKAWLGPPRYRDARFQVASERVVQQIKVVYF